MVSSKATAAHNHRNATSRSNGRRENEAYRVREHLTEAEMDKLLATLRRNRHGHRVGLVGLIIYSHGLRVSEACARPHAIERLIKQFSRRSVLSSVAVLPALAISVRGTLDG